MVQVRFQRHKWCIGFTGLLIWFEVCFKVPIRTLSGLLQVRLGDYKWGVEVFDRWWNLSEFTSVQLLSASGEIVSKINVRSFCSSPHVSPVCLPSQYSELPAGYRCWTTGWGKDAWGNTGQYQNILKVRIKLFSLHDYLCTRFWDCLFLIQDKLQALTENLRIGFQSIHNKVHSNIK
jgi:hypothetical protein